VRVQEVAPDLPLLTLRDATAPPRLSGVTPLPFSTFIRPPTATGAEAEALLRGLQAAVGVLQSAAGSSDFFQRAAQAVVAVAELDSAHVLLREGPAWRAEADYAARPSALDDEWLPSKNVLDRVVRDARTFWQVPEDVAEEAPSLQGIHAVVASPILDRDGGVMGALYGERRQLSGAGAARALTQLDATLVELLAGAVAAGLARLKQEQAALALHVQFEQFFTPELARHLAAHPEMLQGQDAEITALFCDIRGFSRVSERLGPARTVEWVGDVMETLSECVLAEQGVLVDYIGDELIAMWGAPEAQADHPRRAARAALAMLERLAVLDGRWRPLLREPMGLGIGINTGMARVGNTGSKRKFKYGPLGNTVNLASRVQGTTKYLKAQLLVTQATRARLAGEFTARRIGKVRVVNIAEPVELFELAPPCQPGWTELCAAYEQALAEFESQNFRAAARILGTLVTDYRDDGPSLVLMSRAVSHMVDEPDVFDPALKLPGK
jgi:adenylate cyclase